MWGSYSTYDMEDPLVGLKTSLTPGYLRILHDFMASVPYWEMEPMNALVSPNNVVMEGEEFRTNFCLAKPGEVYLVYSMHGGPLTLNTRAGKRYNVIQMNPRTGQETDLRQVNGERLKFSLTGIDQVLLLRAQG
jgi:hypothetical protein